jgi:hypothetical protein
MWCGWVGLSGRSLGDCVDRWGVAGPTTEGDTQLELIKPITSPYSLSCQPERLSLILSEHLSS